MGQEYIFLLTKKRFYKTSSIVSIPLFYVLQRKKEGEKDREGGREGGRKEREKEGRRGRQKKQASKQQLPTKPQHNIC